MKILHAHSDFVALGSDRWGRAARILAQEFAEETRQIPAASERLKAAVRLAARL